MKKVLKALAIGATAGGIFALLYFLDNRRHDDLDDFEEFNEDDFDDIFSDEEDRDYVTLDLEKESAAEPEEDSGEDSEEETE